MAKEAQKHRWRFFSASGFEQIRLDRGEDLLALDQLDQKLWVALACPIDTLEFDHKTLELIDLDKDGRIRAPELISALKWTGSLLKTPDTLLKGSPTLPLAAIDAGSDEGKRLLASAKQILKNLGKKDKTEITIDDTTDTAKIFAETKFNGDGIVPVSSTDERDLQKAIEEIIGIMGAEKDRCGKDGINQEKLDKFFVEAEAFAAWWDAAEKDAANVRPLGEGTAAAAEAFRAVKAKIDDYFTRGKLVAFDERAGAPLNRDPAEYAALASRLLRENLDEVAAFPLSKIEANKPLPLGEGLNPAWSAAMKKLQGEVIAPLLGERTALASGEWDAISTKFAAFEAWHAAKLGAPVEPLGLPRIRAMLDGDYKGKISALIARDKALEPEANAIASVDKLIRFHRDLYRLVNNFVSFRDFYARKKATFQAGTLYLDGRSCDLCIKVADAAAHATLATLSGICIAYCDVQRKGTSEKMTIAAAFTGGDSDALMIGRNGVFYDRKGNDWDATIIKIIEHPISVRQAFWMPYKRIGKLVGQQIERFAASRDKEVNDKTTANVADTSEVVEAGAPDDKSASNFDIAKFAGVFAAIGLALGAIGGALATVGSGLVSLRWWQIPLVMLGVMLLVSGPSMLIAYLKLRRRNIGPMLDAAGWAVNARAKINIPFGASLTQVAKLPADAERSFDDPFEDKKRTWVSYVVLIGLIAGGIHLWRSGRLAAWLDAARTPAPADSAAPPASGAPAASGAPK